jgi:hypothetical protein
MEQVVLRINNSNSNQFSGGRVSMQGNRIVVRVPLIIDITSPKNHDISLGSFPAGSYTVEVYNAPTFGEPILLATREFAVEHQILQPPSGGPQIPVVNYSDMWWNPAEPGWGMTITQRPSGLLLATWFVQDANGKPIWYTLEPGVWTSESMFVGPIYRTDGPYFAGAYAPSNLHQTAVGTGTLTFQQFDNGRFTFDVDGVSGIKEITRFAF